MAELTEDQLDFLKRCDVPMSRVFDATGYRTGEYQKLMSLLELWVAYGVTPCKAEGHTLRDRKGHCVECKPANLSYLRRHDESGEVYVAWSKSNQLVKIGSASDADERTRQLNYYMYGDCFDWTIVYKKYVSRVGKVEARAHQLASEYYTHGYYIKEGYCIECRELFSCEIDIAIEAVNGAICEFSK